LIRNVSKGWQQAAHGQSSAQMVLRPHGLRAMDQQSQYELLQLNRIALNLDGVGIDPQLELHLS